MLNAPSNGLAHAVSLMRHLALGVDESFHKHPASALRRRPHTLSSFRLTPTRWTTWRKANVSYWVLFVKLTFVDIRWKASNKDFPGKPLAGFRALAVWGGS